MIKLPLLVFMYTTLSTAYSEESNGILLTKSQNSKPPVLYPYGFPIFQGPARRVKPCTRRKNLNSADEQWIPSYTSRITQPLYENTVLQPEALKNEDFRTNSPDVDHLSTPDRRSIYPPNFNALVLNDDDDCFDQIATSSETPGNANVEQKALKILNDCIKKKQKNESLAQKNVFASSRRSMSGHDESSNLGNDINFTEDISSSLDSDRNNNYPKIDLDTNILFDGASRRNIDDNNSYKLTTKLIDPAIGTGIAERKPYKYSIPKNGRICYACSTATNPSCWHPNNKTTIKYCPTENSCVKKIFGEKDSLTIIRDCANTCDDSSVPGIEPKYKTCDLCHTDYCNAAISINGYNLAIILFLAIVKHTYC